MAKNNAFSQLSLVLALFSFSFLVTQTLTSDGKHRSAEDEQLEAFFTETMRKYSAWLISHDPFKPNIEPITLKSDKQNDFGVDADLIITGQYMEGHSRCMNSIPGASSDYDLFAFKVTRSCISNGTERYVFGGEYTANGTVNGGSEQEVLFSGSGTWTIKTNETFQMGTNLYSITDDEYFNISRIYSMEYIIWFDWTSVKFEGLQILGESKRHAADSKSNEDILNTVNEVLGWTCKRFLNDWLHFPAEVIPPTRLLRTYLEEVLSETKISDVVANWTRPTTTTGRPTDTAEMTTTTTEAGNEAIIQVQPEFTIVTILAVSQIASFFLH